MSIESLSGLAGITNSPITQGKTTSVDPLEQAKDTSGTRVFANTDDDTSATSAQSQEVQEQFDTFLSLLTAQIQNQDPLAPLDSTQFVDQLATFTGLELQATANNSLESIANLLESQINSEN